VNAPRRVKIIDATGVWFASARLAPEALTGEKLGRWLTRRALQRGIKALYEPATEEEYQAYKALTRKEITK
jgi:hypothetical protein